MIENYTDSFEFRRLRDKAEQEIKYTSGAEEKTDVDQNVMSPESQMYQLELEIQNEELQRSQQELESVLSKYVGIYYDQSPYGYITLSKKGIIKKANLASVSFLGTERANIRFMAFSYFIDTSCQMNYFLSLKKAKQTLRKQSVELQLIANDENKDKWILAHILPDANERNELEQWRIAFLDITEYKNFKTQLEINRNFYKDLFKNLPVACQFIDQSGDIIDSNKRWSELTGYDSDKIKNTPFLQYVHPDWRNTIKTHFEACKKKNSNHSFHFTLQHKDGNPFEANAMIQPCPEGDEDCISACCYVHTKKALQNDTRIQPTINMEDLPGNYMQVDTKGRIVFANKSCHQVLGLDNNALIGRYQWSLAIDSKEEKRIKKWFEYKLERHPSPAPFQMRLKLPEHKQATFQADWNYKYDKNGRLTGILVVLSDLSKQMPDYSFIHQLIKKNEYLVKLENDLEDANHLKSLLIRNENANNKKFKTRMTANIETHILPYVELLKNTKLTAEQSHLVEIMESNFNNIFNPFISETVKPDKRWTPAEFRVADLVMKGKSNKEIAQILSISDRTVGFHREKIRKKLGIVNKKVNLRSILLSSHNSS